MTLWFALALMTAAAIFAVLWPLSRRVPLRAGSDIAVYRDQLEEIERDRATGRIGGSEAEAARVEVSRRLIGAADAAMSESVPQAAAAGTTRRRMVALVALVLLPLGSAGLYLALGSPNLPSEPQAVRLEAPAEQRSVSTLVAQVEAHLEKNPEDGRGWEVLGPVYMRLNRYEDAVKARRNVLRLLGPEPAREADLGEALTGVANGIVTAEAKTAFERALALDPNEFKARFFMGLAAEQDGRKTEAADLWRKLLASAPPQAPWIGFVRDALLRVDPNTPPPSASSAPGPSADDVAAASQLSPEQRGEFVRSMVDRLAERLQREGTDVDGWLRLLRAYMVLGDRDKALAAAGDARRALASEPDKLRRVDELVKGLGLEG
jgi:cytochrome c-type biogenesis protein CcmH